MLLFIATIILSGCATHYLDATNSEPYGFLFGIWHGFCAPFVLMGKILAWFLNYFDVVIFENIKFVGKPNTGTWYFIGYFFGLSICLGGASQ